MKSLSSKPKNTYSKPLGYSGKATSTFSNIFVVILFQRCQSTNYSSMWEISVEVVCAPVREKIKPSCERRQAIYRASLTISDPASSPWPPVQPPALLCRDLPPLRHQPLIARVGSEQKTLVFHRLVISWDIIRTINILYRKGWLQHQCLFNRQVQSDLIHSWNFPLVHVSVSGAQRNWRWQKVKEFVDATGLCGVCGVICNQRRHLRAARGD